MKLQFTIDCIPPKATAQQKKVAMIGGKPRVYEPKNVKDAKNDMLSLLHPHRPEKPLNGPLRLSITWTYPWRSSESKRNRALGVMPCDTRPDCSNLVKAFEDTMTRAGFWVDDSQVYALYFAKFWGDKPGIKVTVESLHV